MISIGQYNTLRVNRFVEFGLYLVAEENGAKKGKEDKAPIEVLLPARYVPDNVAVGDEMRVFVYTDSEDRPVATTEKPYATVGQFAFLQVVAVNRVGAFIDWGLSKNLLVPYSEQKVKMRTGGIYLVYVFLDNATGRVVASARIDRFLGNVFPDYQRGNKVQALVYEHTEIGYKVIVDNLHKGMIYENEIYKPLEVANTINAYVKAVRDDGKIDLTLTVPGTLNRIEAVAAQIMKMLDDGTLTLTDKSSPEEIKAALQCSKKDFKKAVGALYKEHRIAIAVDGSIHAI